MTASGFRGAVYLFGEILDMLHKEFDPGRGGCLQGPKVHPHQKWKIPRIGSTIFQEGPKFIRKKQKIKKINV